jgi:hypothetical protein
MSYPMNPDLETPAEDAAEQAASAVPSQADDADSEMTMDVEAPEWDAQEQGRVLELDDDEYR